MLLQVNNITKQYGDRAVLNGLSLQVAEGEKIAIVGPSGSGKTTLLNIIGAIDKPDDGEVIFDKTTLKALGKKQMANFRNNEIGFVFQLHHLLPQCSLWENVLLPTLVNKNNAGAEQRAEELLKQTGIWEQRSQKPAELSGGECQRTAVVRALINQPSLVLADEPTGALDEDNANTLADLLISMNTDKNLAIILVTHSMELAKKMDKVYLLKKGKLVLNEQS